MGDDYYNEGNVSVPCASWAPAVGFMGCVFAVVFSSELKILKEKSMVLTKAFLSDGRRNGHFVWVSRVMRAFGCYNTYS
jgi:hypothetical protein